METLVKLLPVEPWPDLWPLLTTPPLSPKEYHSWRRMKWRLKGAILRNRGIRAALLIRKLATKPKSRIHNLFFFMLKKFISFAHHPRIPMQCVNAHRTRHRKCIYQCRVSELIHDWRYTTHLVLPLLLHTVGNLHFLSKNSTLISPRKLSILLGGEKICENVVVSVWGFLAVDNLSKKFGWKTRENVVDCGFGLFSCWQLWFHEKNCQKNWVKNVGVLSKLNFWT